MATMKKFRVTLDVTINDDETYTPDKWDWDRIAKGDYTALDSGYGEKAEFVSANHLDTWEEGDEDEDSDDDDEATCEFSDGERVKCVATARELIESCAMVDDPIEAARMSGHVGKVIDTDPGCAPEVHVEFDNGEDCWLCEDQLDHLVETVGG